MAEENAMAVVDDNVPEESVETKMEFKLINPTKDGFLRHIDWNKAELEQAVRQKVADYENVVYTEDTMKQGKKDRAELNKTAKAIEERMKTVEEKVMEPYNIFKAEVKEVLALIQEPVNLIDSQIKAFEEQQKDEKKKELQKVYDENIGELKDILTFEQVFDKRYLNATYKLKQASTEITERIARVKTDLDTIDGLESKYKLNAKDVYIKTLDLSKALAENKRLQDLEEKLEAENRRKAEEAEKKRQAEEKRKQEEEERRKQKQEAAVKAIPSSSAPSRTYWQKPETAPENVTGNQESDSKSDEGVINSSENVMNKPESVSETVKSENVGISAIDPFTSQPAVKEKRYRARFYAVGTKEQLNALTEYMKGHGIEYGKVEK